MSEDKAMENKKQFVVFKPAEVWFSVRVEAGSKEEALAMAEHPTSSRLWEMDPETLFFVDGEWEVYSDEEDDK
jgi:ribulose-5-phosphate 4-epimerase/fuculose-1-phosphate aldolase